jgi:hypothetical protein
MIKRRQFIAVTAKAATASEIEGAFAMLVGEGVGALIVGGDLTHQGRSPG